MTDTTGDGQGPIKVMVVDDHPMWRDAVARDLGESGFDVVATAGDGDQAVRRAKAAAPDVLVLDLNLPAKPGVQVCKELVAHNPALRVLVLSASGEHADVLEAVKSGATGYLLKSASTEELLDAVRRTAVGDPVFTPGLAGLVLGEYRRLASEPAPAPDADAPGAPVPLPPGAARELAAAVGAALDNVRKHAGEHARAWILVEDEPDEVIVTVRDDGPGIPEGRLAQAEGEGRLGVALSIRGRLRDIGGSAELISVPGQGTEVELKVPKDSSASRGKAGQR